jgi:predicted nucleic acid-binding protein
MAGRATIVLDTEAVEAALDAHHAKHRRMMAVLEVASSRQRRRSGSSELIVPTTVRVEAGWDRRARTSAAINRLRAADVALSSEQADVATRIRRALGISVVDAHVGAVMGAADGPVSVITSDAGDMDRIAAHLDLPSTTVLML